MTFSKLALTAAKFSFVSIALISFGAQADEVRVKEVTLNLSEVYVPGGFSSETEAFVVASGTYPNSCYRFARSEVATISPNVHEVRSIAAVSQTRCLMVLVPYQREIRIGRLASGEHTLRFMNGDGTYFEKQLTIE